MRRVISDADNVIQTDGTPASGLDVQKEWSDPQEDAQVLSKGIEDDNAARHVFEATDAQLPEPAALDTVHTNDHRALDTEGDNVNEAAPEDASPSPEATPEPEPEVVPGLGTMDLTAFNIEFADPPVLERLVEFTYTAVAAEKGYDDGLLTARDLPDYLARVLNPLDEDISDDERTRIRDAAATLREQEGLLDDGKVVFHGFLARGSPLDFTKALAVDMHHYRRRRLLAVEL
ncbi:TPA: hypothetical protein N0F65_003140 [Lagenidium giganteum]|uniref:Uncharacterized protein n=1 Tax=Lagenidium giganteum TaxID=4803 RepID=A0AAV2YJH0_9STRA|nr:TPA: hypothetical protein N0F65_003140 [Lagenidium giganteum]